MARNWTDAENDVVVEVYFRMLSFEARGRDYVKKEFNEEVQSRTGRSRGSVEYKLQNVSAVLMEDGFPCIDGYKPYPNYQGSLRSAVKRHLAKHALLDEPGSSSRAERADIASRDTQLDARQAGGR